jgi:predicted nucleotidyltransferase component of viral defense system
MIQPRRLNMAASVRQRLLDLTRARGEEFEYLLTRYGLERFLYRLGCSPYRERFILKGAMLLLLWGMDDHRPTRDADLLGFGDDDAEELVATFREVCQVAVDDDGLLFDPASVQATAIREEMEYGGIRIKLAASLGKARISVQLDVGFGDAVTPAAEEATYPAIIDLPPPRLRVYPKETVIAEKFHAMVHLGMANSRMKDFYDIWTISRTLPFAGETLSLAIQRTFQRRQTAVPAVLPLALTAEFFGNPAKEMQWHGFVRRNGLAGRDMSLAAVTVSIAAFIMPPCLALAAVSPFLEEWTTGGPWQSPLI